MAYSLIYLDLEEFAFLMSQINLSFSMVHSVPSSFDRRITLSSISFAFYPFCGTTMEWFTVLMGIAFMPDSTAQSIC